MKKHRVTGKERIMYATQQNLIRQVGILTPEEREELNHQLDEIDKMDPNEAVGATLALSAWLQSKWDKYNEPICVKCENRETCKRQQTVKKCKFFEEVGSNETE